uniref:Uncharacterized protein n=1 Tax=Pristionchus pacificus TaxID=54126 RepID=A0A2A6CMM7_PRIPA|eukprot:PDM79452.1 hypothetical protein PRIPAC_32031 [Pristionchus pacificus]
MIYICSPFMSQYNSHAYAVAVYCGYPSLVLFPLINCSMSLFFVSHNHLVMFNLTRPSPDSLPINNFPVPELYPENTLNSTIIVTAILNAESLTKLHKKNNEGESIEGEERKRNEPLTKSQVPQ